MVTALQLARLACGTVNEGPVTSEVFLGDEDDQTKGPIRRVELDGVKVEEVEQSKASGNEGDESQTKSTKENEDEKEKAKQGKLKPIGFT